MRTNFHGRDRGHKKYLKAVFFQYIIFLSIIHHLKIMFKTNEVFIFCYIWQMTSLLLRSCIVLTLKSFKHFSIFYARWYNSSKILFLQCVYNKMLATVRKLIFKATLLGFKQCEFTGTSIKNILI